MHTLVAWAEDIDTSGGRENLVAIPDPHVRTILDNITIPTLNQIVALAAMVGSGGDGFARLEAPSLLTRSRHYISPVNGGADAASEPDSPPKVQDFRVNPLALRMNEDAQVIVESATTTSEEHSVLMWLADGPITPVTGQIFTLRGAATLTQTALRWSNTAIVFEENLPVGRYAIVGMRVQGATMLAARLVFRGGEGWRPGVIACDSDNDLDHPMFRMGQFGLFGEFESIQPPSVDFLSNAADSVQDIYLDLIQVRSGP